MTTSPAVPVWTEAQRRHDDLRATVEIVTSIADKMQPSDMPGYIDRIYTAVTALGAPKETAPEAPVPAVPTEKAVTPDAVTCLDCGKTFHSLRRHIRTAHGLTPEEYRKRWGLSASFPIVAPNYSDQRSALAKASGLGTK